MVIKEQIINAEQFYEITQTPEYDDLRVELIEGCA